MEKQVKIKTGKSLTEMLKAVVREGLKSDLYQNAVEEKRRQDEMLGEEDDDAEEDLFGGDEKKGGGEEKKPEPATSSKTVDDEKEKLKKGDVSVDDVVDKLNVIRGGKSFKDPAVSGKMSEYVESLSKAEKVALLSFLKGLAQIMTGEVEASQAINPAEDPADVKMKKGGEHKEKKIKPTVVKGPDKPKEKKPSSEDTSGPVPINPVKK